MTIRVLFANELGAGLSHVRSLHAIHMALEAHGAVEPLYVVKAPETAIKLGFAPGQVRMAPRDAVMASAKAERKQASPRSYGEMVMSRLFMAKGTGVAWLSGWDQILREFDPHVVVTDFCPAAQIMAFGRWPVFAYGQGYTLPPADTASFASFSNWRPLPPGSEAEQIDKLNRVLAPVSGRRIERLPEICRADAHVTATVPPFDPYLPLRPQEDYAGQRIPGGAPWPGPRKGGAIAYFHEMVQGDLRLTGGLAASGLATDAYLGVPTDDLKARLSGGPITLSEQPFALKAAMPGRAVGVHMGGIGFALAAAFAGVPQLILHTHQENAFVGSMVHQFGAGIAMDYRASSPAEIGKAMQSIAGDPLFAQQALDLGKRLAPFRDADPVAKSAVMIRALLGKKD